MLSLVLGDSDGNPAADPVEASWADLATQCPDMCTLQEMHRRVAACPRTQAKFWLLMDDLVDRYLLAIGHYYVGSHRNAQLSTYNLIEDDYCSSLRNPRSLPVRLFRQLIHTYHKTQHNQRFGRWGA